MIYSGLDWSGTPGPEQGATVVFAVVHFPENALRTLNGALDVARSALGVSPSYVFKNNGTRPRTREAFFRAIAPLDFSAHIHMLDKRQWAERQQPGQATGPQLIRDGIVSLVTACPAELVARQVLFVDIPPSQRAELSELQTKIRRALRTTQPPRMGFAALRGCEDHRRHGAIIQVADLLAGQVKDYGGIAGPHLPALGTRITMV